MPEKKCRTVTQTVVDTILDTRYEKKCQTSLSTVCDTVTVTTVENVPDKECTVVEEKQCSTVWQSKLDRECRYTRFPGIEQSLKYSVQVFKSYYGFLAVNFFFQSRFPYILSSVG